MWLNPKVRNSGGTYVRYVYQLPLEIRAPTNLLRSAIEQLSIIHRPYHRFLWPPRRTAIAIAQNSTRGKVVESSVVAFWNVSWEFRVFTEPDGIVTARRVFCDGSNSGYPECRRAYNSAMSKINLVGDIEKNDELPRVTRKWYGNSVTYNCVWLKIGERLLGFLYFAFGSMIIDTDLGNN